MDTDRLIDEDLLSFTHTTKVPWLLPGVSPTEKQIEVVGIVIAAFENGKLARDRVYWDQTSVLAQVALLDIQRLPVTGNQAARLVRSRMRRPQGVK